MSTSAIGGSVGTELSQVIYHEGGIPFVGNLQKIAKLYADIFAAGPWNEVTVCSQKHYSQNQPGTICEKCKEPLELAYPENKVMSLIFEEAGNQRGGCLVVFQDRNATPYAVGWGYIRSVKEFCDVYATEEMKQMGAKAIQDYVKNNGVFYLAEVIVDPKLRQRGMGTRIVEILLGRAKELNHHVVLHTHKDSPMAMIARKVQMITLLDAGTDKENEGRIVFGLPVQQILQGSSSN